MRKASSDAVRWETVAWNELIPRLLVFARRHRQRFADSMSLPSEEDLVFDAIEKTIGGVRSWEPNQIGLLPHLFGVIRSDLFNEVRKAQNYVSGDASAEQLASFLPSEDATPEDIAASRSVLTAFLNELKVKDKQAYDWFSLVSLHGLSGAQALEALGDEDNINNMRRKLRRHIAEFVEDGETKAVKRIEN